MKRNVRDGMRLSGLKPLVAALLLSATGCNDGVGGPLPCTDDLECVPICEAACGSAPIVSAECDDFLRACVCGCEIESADAGAPP